MQKEKNPQVSDGGQIIDGSVDGEGESRGKWGNQCEFILTCVGFSVGLGNVWRFPYLTYQNGGGAFLVPYVLTLIFVGIPLYMMELSFGQFASLGPFTIWKINPLFKGLGLAAIIVCWYILIYFNVIISWCLYFMFSAMQETLPWTSCNNTWNKPTCLEDFANATADSTTPSHDFFYHHVLELSDGLDTPGSVRWQLLLLLFVSWVVVFLVLIKGIESLGKVSYFVAIFPYILLTCMLIRGATLDGAVDGIIYYLNPDFNRLTEFKVWGEAATQIFYSLGLGMGNLIVLASYNNFNHKIFRDGLMIPIINCLTSLYAGFVIFSVLGYMAKTKNLDISEVAAEGPGLVFVVYPEGLATMPIPQLWSVLFFMMMTSVGYSSQFSFAETICSSLLDEFPGFLKVGYRPFLLRLGLCVFSFLMGIPMITQGGYYIFQMLNDYSTTYSLLVIAFLELAALLWIYGYSKFAEDIALMLGTKPPLFFKICWLVVTPIVTLAIFIFIAANSAPLTMFDVPYPDWGMTLAWLIAMFPIVCIVLVGLGVYCKRGGYQLLVQNSRPEDDWGPALGSNRKGVYRDSDLRRRDDLSYVYFEKDSMIGAPSINVGPPSGKSDNDSINGSFTNLSIYLNQGYNGHIPQLNGGDSKMNGHVPKMNGNIATISKGDKYV